MDILFCNGRLQVYDVLIITIPITHLLFILCDNQCFFGIKCVLLHNRKNLKNLKICSTLQYLLKILIETQSNQFVKILKVSPKMTLM
jgi:hypothetical protein